MKRIPIIFSLALISIFLCISSVFASEKVFFYYTDPAGTPLAMTDTNGTVVWRADYKPFGEEKSVTGTIENNEKFVGKEKDKETGLYYFGARYMKAEIGRFTSPDPVGPVDPRTSKINEKVLKNPQRLNLYAYAGNNPFKLIDPFGLFWEYSQSTGELTFVNNDTEARTLVAEGYSGHGEGLNNPDMQDVPYVGPIPQGTYDIGPAYRHARLGPVTMNLDPLPETDTFDRDAFRIHSDNSRGDQSASEGCIVLPRNVRDQISNSGDNELRVIE